MLCVGVCLCVCVCGVCVMCFLNIYVQHVPLYVNISCPSVHVFHCLSFW